jgi:NIMA (never in mitosis gene a)-related kinase 1/4/5
LQLPAISKRLDERYLMEVDEGIPFLLNTIRVPKNIHYLTDRLPKPNYTPLKTRKVDKQKFLQTLAGYPEAERHLRDSDMSQSPLLKDGVPLRLPQISNNKQQVDTTPITGGGKSKKRKDAQSVPQREYQEYSQIDNVNHHKYSSENDVSLLIAEANKNKENRKLIEMPKVKLNIKR